MKKLEVRLVEPLFKIKIQHCSKETLQGFMVKISIVENLLAARVAYSKRMLLISMELIHLVQGRDPSKYLNQL